MPKINLRIVKKNIKKKKHSQVYNVLKKSVEATNITNQILDLGSSLTVDNLIVSLPAIEKQLTKTIFEDEVFQFYVNTLELAKVLKLSTFYS